MSTPPRILAFAGATRRESFNKKLIAVAAAAAQAAGGEVTLIDLRDYALPLYDGDLEAEEGLPANVLRLKELFKAHEGLLLAAPEYNSSITGVLKNVIDWVSRPAPGEKTLECFKGKSAALLAASPGALGGLRGLVHVRAILGNLGVLVLPDQAAVGRAQEAFDASGGLHDPAQAARVEDIARNLVDILRRLRQG